jgi:hypothetical protein
LENSNLEDPKGDEKVKLKWILKNRLCEGEMDRNGSETGGGL